MAAGRLLIPGWNRAVNGNGNPIAAAISLFNTGTDALATVYADEALTVPLANPVQSNSAGRFPAIWADDANTFDWSVTAPYGPPGSPFTGTGLTTALTADILIAEAAEAAAASAEAALADVLAVEASGSDAAAIAARAAKAANLSDLADGDTAFGNLDFVQAGAGAVTRTAKEKARDVVNLLDFIPVAQHAAIKAKTSTYDATADMQAALLAATGKTIVLPPGVIRFGNVGGLQYAGTRILGDSRYETIIKPVAGMTPGTAIFSNSEAASGSSAYTKITGIRFEFEGVNVIGVDLSSVNNSVIEECYFAGSFAGTVQTGVGVRFGSPLDEAAYSNNVRDCAFYSLAKGVEYLINANSNMVTGGECIYCAIGVDAGPTGYVDTPRVIGMRFEGGTVGIREKSQGANYIACRFENNSTADIDFIDNGSGDQSVRPMVIGGYTATSPNSLRNLANAASPVILSPDMGRYDIEATTQPKWFGGRHVFATAGTALPVSAPNIGYSAFFYDAPVIRNNVAMEWTDAAGANSVLSIVVDSGNRLNLRAFDRAAGVDRDVLIGGGSAVRAIGGNATDLGSSAAPWKDIFAGGAYYVDGVKVVGNQGAALPADATDLATAIALVNAMKARLVAHGLVA